MHAAASLARGLVHRSTAARRWSARARAKAHSGKWACGGADHFPPPPWVATALCLLLCGAGKEEGRRRKEEVEARKARSRVAGLVPADGPGGAPAREPPPGGGGHSGQ